MWTFGGTKIIVTDEAIEDKQIIARLQPLNDGTILQTFGYEDPITKLKGYVVSKTDLDALRNMSKSATTYTLMENATNRGSYYLNSIGATRLNVVSQTIRPDLSCTETVYEVQLELYS